MVRVWVTVLSGGRGYSWQFLVGACHTVLQILTLFQTKICHFSHPFSDLASKIHNRFQTWPLRNYVIITQIRTPTKKISFFLIYLKLKQWIRSYITVGSSKPVPDSRPKWAKTIPVLRSKRRNKHTLWNGTYLYGLYMGVPSPLPGSFKNQSLPHFPMIHFVSTTSFFNSLRTYNYPKGIQWENCFCKSCVWRKGQRKMYYGKCGSGVGNGFTTSEWLYWLPDLQF